MFLFLLKRRTEYNVHATVHSISHEMNWWLWWEWSPGIVTPLLQLRDGTVWKNKNPIWEDWKCIRYYSVPWQIITVVGLNAPPLRFAIKFTTINFEVRQTMRVKPMFLLQNLHFIHSWKCEYELWTPWLANFSWGEDADPWENVFSPALCVWLPLMLMESNMYLFVQMAAK